MIKTNTGRAHSRQALAHITLWAGLCFVALALVAATCSAQERPTENLMWRPQVPGQMSQYQLPQALERPPSQWPSSGWVRLTHKTNAIQVSTVGVPQNGLPEFLRDLANAQLDADGWARGSACELAEAEAEAIDSIYLRLRGVALKPGRVETVNFPTGMLRPRIGRPYRIAWGVGHFELRVFEGKQNRRGALHGNGARYEIRYGGQLYTYVLDGSGWDTEVRAVADLDGDSRPDFIVRTAQLEAVLLSSEAKPGLNRASAVLRRVSLR